MSKMNFRRLGLAVLTGAALALAGCATPFRADVARFQSQLPAPQGQTFVVEAGDPSLDGGIEFGQYANLVAGELTRFGYRAAAPGEKPELLVRMNYGIDKGRERVRSTGFNDPWYGGGFYGPGYRPVVVRGPNGRRYIYGWRDPFMWGGFGPGYNDVESYTVYTSGLQLTINRASDGMRLFEGRAEAQSRDNNLTLIIPNLIEAMFTDFPGNSGEKVQITVAPPPK
ncbi:DUF4136 domain-containing protein [Sphingopyxis witflariensis]|uniref:Lipoprotein transmembrane n=1 Tax=Sphingopyxis witflariensis TaxID=173675 RepID=A0A246K0Z3_9SPHN|nr:DUF4136 domain-containing protein [Sphingopyxis witflariensis]OWQ98539.1 lipoprotein transmembrane [Sphingopyxis witflariensis]